MSHDALRALADAQRQLVAALDATDTTAIEAANARLHAAVLAVRAAGAWHGAPELRAEVAAAIRVNHAGRIRAGYHADRTRRRIAVLASLRRPAAAPSYGRNGRYRLPLL